MAQERGFAIPARPSSGVSRSFGNEYTRLFIRYLCYEDAKLGKEGIITGEKFKLGFEIVWIGVSRVRRGLPHFAGRNGGLELFLTT